MAVSKDDRFLVGTDPGVDDMIALALLHKLSPGLDHGILPTFANGPIEYVTRNSSEFIQYCAPDFRLTPACALPLSGTVERPYPDYFHGPDAVWNVHIDGNQYPTLTDGTFEISANDMKSYTSGISLGALTSFSSQSPDFSDVVSLDNVAVMGGVFDEEGNETDYAETNIAFDPDAADDFFSMERTETRLAPLDATRKVTWDLEMANAMPITDATSWWIKTTLLAWFENYSHQREENLCLHDPLTVWLIFHPEDAVWQKTGVRVILDGEQRGQTVRDDSRPECLVAMDLVDPERIQKDIWHTIFS